MRPCRPKRALYALVVAVGLLTAACATHAPQTTLKPEGPAARKIDGLFHLTLVWVVVFFIIVEFGVVFLILRYRHRDDSPEPVQVHGNTRLELTWTLVPALILLTVAV